jgi:hypothetical protein
MYTFCFRCLTLVLVQSSYNIIQIQPFYEVDASLYRPKRYISTEDVVRGRYASLGRCTTCID